MNILLVSHSIPPYKGGSSVIVENLVKNFSPEEMSVIGSKTLFQKGIESASQYHYFFSELSFFGRGARFFDWFRKLRFSALKKAIKKLAIYKKVDYIIGVYPNSFYCLAACQVAQELDLPFSSYFHNTYVENEAIKEPDAKLIQEEIFDYSEHIFVMSEGMQAFYQKAYGTAKFVPLVHTFQELPNDREWTPIETKKTYKLVAIGNFNESNIEATQRFLRAISTTDKYELSIYTHVPKVLLSKRGLNTEQFKHLGFIKPGAIHEALQDYDICILTHGFDGGYGAIEYETIFPTRTIPLLLSGKPILAHSPSHSFLSEFIKKHECAVLVEEREEIAILEGLDKIVGNIDLQKSLYNAASATARMFYGPAVAEFLKSKLRGESQI